MRTTLAGLALLALFILGGIATTVTGGITEPERNRPPVSTQEGSGR